MSDQTIQVKYVGTAQRWPELAITGRQSAWMPGQIESRAPSEATALLATGLFSSPPVPVMATTGPGGGVVFDPAVPYATNIMSFIPSPETRAEHSTATHTGAAGPARRALRARRADGLRRGTCHAADELRRRRGVPAPCRRARRRRRGSARACLSRGRRPPVRDAPPAGRRSTTT